MRSAARNAASTMDCCWPLCPCRTANVAYHVPVAPHGMPCGCPEMPAVAIQPTEPVAQFRNVSNVSKGYTSGANTLSDVALAQCYKGQQLQC